jgi:hypothetical protein
MEWQGDDKNGKYLRYGRPHVSRILDIRIRLADNADQLEKYKQGIIDMGRPEPYEPPEFLKKRLQLEAEFDVCTEELEQLDEWLAEAAAVVQKIDDTLVLKRGPLGGGKMKEGILVEFDG